MCTSLYSEPQSPIYALLGLTFIPTLVKSTTTDHRVLQSQQDQQASTQEPDRKRRPGRPRGSKNRKPRAGTTATKQQEGQFYYQGHSSLHPGSGSTPPQHPDVNVHNQQYYEFQWRVLNLCAEFYNAAEELVVSAFKSLPSHAPVNVLLLERNSATCHSTILSNGSQQQGRPPCDAWRRQTDL